MLLIWCCAFSTSWLQGFAGLLSDPDAASALQAALQFVNVFALAAKGTKQIAHDFTAAAMAAGNRQAAQGKVLVTGLQLFGQLSSAGRTWLLADVVKGLTVPDKQGR